MTKELLSNVKIIEKDDTYIMDKHYQFELSYDEIQKFKKELAAQLETCENEKSKCEGEHLEQALEKVKQQADEEYRRKQDALNNFSKYQREIIQKFKDNAREEMKELKQFCDEEVFKKYKEMLIEGLKQKKQQEKENYEAQIKHLTEQLQAYEGY